MLILIFSFKYFNQGKRGFIMENFDNLNKKNAIKKVRIIKSGYGNEELLRIFMII